MGLGFVGLLFVFFAAMSVFEGRGRDAAECGIPGVLVLGAAAFVFVRVVQPRLRDRSRLARLDAARDRWTA
jgi:hypothetical protein